MTFTPVDINNACEFCTYQANQYCMFKMAIAMIITFLVTATLCLWVEKQKARELKELRFIENTFKKMEKKTFEMWLPPWIVKTIGKSKKWLHLANEGCYVVSEDGGFLLDENKWYVNGERIKKAGKK